MFLGELEVDRGPCLIPKIIENIMMSIVFRRRWEVMGAATQPPKIIENIMISIVFEEVGGDRGRAPSSKSWKTL